MTDTDGIELADVRRLVVHPGETLVVTVHEADTAEDLDRVAEAVLRQLPEVRVLVTTDNVDMEVVSGG